MEFDLFKGGRDDEKKKKEYVHRHHKTDVMKLASGCYMPATTNNNNNNNNTTTRERESECVLHVPISPKRQYLTLHWEEKREMIRLRQSFLNERKIKNKPICVCECGWVGGVCRISPYTDDAVKLLLLLLLLHNSDNLY